MHYTNIKIKKVSWHLAIHILGGYFLSGCEMAACLLEARVERKHYLRMKFVLLFVYV